MFDRTERLLSRAQRALRRHDFAAAEALLDAAIGTDAAYPPLHVYRALALAEQERGAEAEQALDIATALAPASFVPPLHRGIVRLDAGDAGAAIPAFERAVRLAPGNPVPVGYLQLSRWPQGHADALAPLATTVRDLPESFRARLLLELAARVLRVRGPAAMVTLIQPPLEPAGLPIGLWIAGRWHGDPVAYARRLVSARRFEEAAVYLAAMPAALVEPGASELLERARRQAAAAYTDAIAVAPARRQRTLLLHRYEIENDLGDGDAAYATLGAWRDAWQQAGAPDGERHVAADVLRRLAELEIERGRPVAALELCAASRAARRTRETDGVEGLARLALGHRRAARHRFEDFLADALFPLDAKITEVVTSTA